MKCIQNYGLTFEGANWTCPHCQDRCPSRAKCYAYDRQTLRRREKTMQAKITGSGVSRDAAGVGTVDTVATAVAAGATNGTPNS